MDIRIEPQVHEEAQPGGDELARDRRHGGAGHLQPGKAEQAENQDGVQNDVDQRARDLGNHGVHRPPCGLEQPLKAELAENADGEAQADPGVVRAVVHDGGNIRLSQEEGPGQQKAARAEGHGADQEHKDARIGGLVRLVLLFLPQGAGEQGVHADARAAAHGDHQVLEGKGQGDGVQRVLADAGDKDAVHHVVEGLDQHGDHHGHRHAGQEGGDGHRSHLVLLGRGGG